MTVRLTVDGAPVVAEEGSMLTAALVGSGHWQLRTHLVTGEPRGPLCGMGICFECEVSVDDQRDVRACITPVHDGMSVDTRHGEQAS